MNSNISVEDYKDRQILVTGATGYTGSYLVKKLVALGANVRALARPSSDRSKLKSLPVKWYIGQVYDREVLKEAMNGVEYVFHVAAAFREAKISDQQYELVHVDSTKHIAELATSEPRFKRLIHTSTMGVHGHIKNPPGSEVSPYAPGDEYQRTKLKAELWLHDYAKANKLPYTVIRPTAIFGPAETRLFKIFKMASQPFFLILGGGKCLYHLIHVDDLTDAFLLAGIKDSALGEAFIVGNEESIALEDFARFIAAGLGRKLRIIRLPVAPFFILADCCEFICKPMGIEPPIYRRRVAFYTKDRSFD
ncbi:MAG: NAD-dependent epimerase/dehydratase family protein, partial [Candidatus Dadabacteria bacterium]